MKYERYKDSGIEWVGKIPEHWEVRKIRTLGSFSSSGIDKKIKSGENLISIINYTDVYGNKSHELYKSDYMVVSATKNQIDKHLVNKGDMIFTPSSETIEDIGISAVVVEKLENTAFSYHVLRFVFYEEDSICLSYKKYLCNNHYIYNYFSSLARGTTRQTLNRGDFKNTLLIIPSMKEQEKISNYLDEKTSKIDLIIESLELQKEKLELYKREIISEVVTKGLDKNIPMKDSGVDWIGQVPEHWEIHPLFSIFKQNKVKNIGMENDNLLSLSYGNIIRKDIDTTFGLLPENFESYQIVDKGYIILRLTDLQNDKKSLRTALVNEKGIITSAYIGLVEINSKCNTDYMHYLLHSYDLRKVFYSMGSGLRQSLNFDDIKRLPIVLPKDDEQKEIVEYLDYRVNKVESIKNKLQLQIEKLRDYRKIVIHEAVTGKVKVLGGGF